MMDNKISKSSKLRTCLCATLGFFCGIFLLFLIILLFIEYKVFFPTCPRTNGRICNGRGVCQGGYCICDPRFSGYGCTDTLIPGYNAITNQECSGNGFGWPFSNFPSFCRQTIKNGKLVGPGWYGKECQEHFQRTMTQLAEISNDRLLHNSDNLLTVYNATTIPWCQCKAEYGGSKCQVKQCPSDENGLICGGNGNKTVGILTNQTAEDQTGCQCSSQVRFDQPPLLQAFTPGQQQLIRTTYYGYFNQILCARLGLYYNRTISIQIPPNVEVNNKTIQKTPITNDGEYSCFCEYGWGGKVCTENQCPRPVETGEICSNVGHPSYGQGLITNTTKQKSKGRDCLVKCVEGTSLCNTQVCLKTQSPATPLFSASTICTYGSQCIQPNPVRCFDGSCVPIPANARECSLNYQAGSIDPTQINTLLNPCTIQSESTLRACFLNSSLEALGYERKGFLWNSSLPLRFDLGSPLAYFQFSTNSSETYVKSVWSEQTFFTNLTLVSGSFSYNSTGQWIEDGQVVANKTSIGYSLCGISTNYSGSVSVPSNFTKVRLTDPVGGQVYVLDIQDSSLNLSKPTNQTYLLVSETSNLQGAAQTWFYAPSGLVVDRSFCLSSPSDCSFIVWDDQVRNLESTAFVCHSLGLPIIQTFPCATPYSTYRFLISNYLWAWETCLTGLTTFTTATITEPIVFNLERNYTERKTYENQLEFFPPEQTILISYPSFLTVADVTFPCACSPVNQLNNQSSLNQQWWGEQALRPVDDLVLGDWVLTSTIVNGEQEFLRSKIVGFSPLNSSFSVWNPQLDIYYDSFYSNSRRISLDEVLDGSSDKNLIIQPFRCPDGQQSSADVVIQSIPTLCNCTYTTPLVDCTCKDRMFQNWTCSCQMDEQYCQCETPALPDFEIEMYQSLANLTDNSCQCIIYDPQPGEQTNTSVTTTTGEFNITLSQIPEFLIVKTSGALCNLSTSIQLIGRNPQLFINVSIDITLFEGEIQNCEHWFTINWPNEYAISHLTVISVIPIEWSTLQFSIHGFSLNTISTSPTFTSSSQGISPASVVILRNSTFWQSNQTTIPVWIEVDYHRAFFLQYISVVFYQAGVLFNGYQIPWRIFLQGWLGEESGWKTLGSFGVYVEEGGWSERSLFFNTTQQYSKFRLITENGNFAIRQWSMYANQACLCQDGSLLTLQMSSLQGLPSIQLLLDEIDSYQSDLLGPGCVCENTCILKVAGNSTQDFSNDGICEDAIYVASLFGITPEPVFIANTSFNYTDFGFKLFTWEVLPGISSIQFATSTSLFLNETEQIEFYGGEQQNNLPNFPPNVSNPNVTGLFPNQTIFYLNTTTLITIPTQIPRGDPYEIVLYENETFFMITQNFTINYGGVVENNLACCAGCDCNDCGSSIRNKVVQTGVQCQYTPAQSNLILLMTLGNTIVNQTYFISNLSSLTHTWSGFYHGIPLIRQQPLSVLLNCPSQVCPKEHPIRCLNGDCKNFLDECNVRFNCPGNGCVQQTDAASLGNVAYRCACQLGYSGDACQFGATLPATPEIFIGQIGYTPGGLAAHCGGPPPLRMIPPIVNENRFMEPSKIVSENLRQTANSPRKGSQQLGYFRVMPNNGWGAVVTFPWLIKQSKNSVLPDEKQYDQTDCPPARRGYHGEVILQSDDLEGEDPVTLAPIWRVYTNPFTGVNETFTWDGVFPLDSQGNRYHDFPYRCPNAQCVADPANCTQSVALFPLCNGAGECRADGSCLCRAGRKTGIINERMSDLVKYPYGLNNDNIPDPTIWELNFNWRYFGLLQCLERDCEEEFCGTPTGCFPGTPSLGFVDRWHLCDSSTRNAGKCAPPGADCTIAKGLELPLVCSGKGIPKVKDFTGEIYCYCGDPISPTASITDITQISDLKKGGWGGIACQTYNAPDATLVWSQWDFQRDQPYYDQVTGEALPGRWIKANIPVGPKPEDRVLWENCCTDVERLQSCDKVICDDAGDLVCINSIDCVAPKVPQIFNCNGHGVARADGTCECESSQMEGFGYTSDLTQFDTEGCYSIFQCPISKRNQAPCYFLEACTQPGESRYPAPEDAYLSQQTYMCGPREGSIQNSTIINQISTSANIFLDRLIQAFTQIAIEVQSAIVSLNGCICVYPNDTQLVKTGMLPGQNYTYKQSYHAPSLLFGNFPGYPFLTDFTEEMYGNESYVFQSGDTFEFHMSNILPTNISAVRFYGEAQVGSSFSVVTSSLQLACSTISPIDPQIGVLGWLSGSGSNVDAFYCGPFYKCASFETLPDYTQNCGASSLTEACSTWKNQQCFSDPGKYRYWPLDSPAIYEGCDRGSNGCTCCEVQLNTIYSPITNGIVKFIYSSNQSLPIRLGQVQVYGVTEAALQMPSGLVTYLQQKLPGFTDASQCQDYQFLSSYLGAPEGLFFEPPPRPQDSPRKLNFTDSFLICNQTGGYLGIPASVGEAQGLTGSSNSLMRQCNNLVNTQKECWVGAKDTRFNELYTERDQMFFPGCTTCYEPGFFQVENFGSLLSFSTYPTNPDVGTSQQNYRQAVFSSQINTKTSLNDLFLSTNPTQKVSFWTQLCSDQFCSNPNQTPSCAFDVSYQLLDGLKIIIGGKYPTPLQGKEFYNYITFRYIFEGSAGKDVNKVARIRAVASTTIPLNQGDPFLLCVQPCVELEYKNIGIDKLDLSYGQVPDIFDTCMLFNSGTSEIYTKDFCGILNKDASMMGLSFFPDNCGFTNLYANSDCPNLKSVKSVNAGSVANSIYTYGGDPCNFLYEQGWLMPPFGAKYELYWSQHCGSLEIYKKLQTTKIGCFAFYNQDPTYLLEVSPFRIQYTSTGKFGDNFAPGVNDFPFLPTFLQIQILESRIFYQQDNILSKQTIQSQITPIYFIAKPRNSGYRLQATFKTAPIKICSECYQTLIGNFEWQDFIYSQALVWLTSVSSQSVTIPPVEIYVQNIKTQDTIYKLTAPPTSRNKDLIQPRTFVHLTTYIQSRNATKVAGRNDTYQWYLSTCLAVTASSYITKPCREALNFICQFDYLRYSVVTGYMCDKCGDNTRISGLPQPGQTCYDSNPLANATAYPTYHEIYANYLRRTLLYYVQTITPPTDLKLPPGNLIWAIPECWNHWKNGEGTRGPQSGGTVPRGQLPSLDWYDTCLSCNWGVDCQKEGYSIIDPSSNQEVRTCAVSASFCDLSKPATGNAPLNTKYYPPLFNPVSVDVATSDKTCGDTVLLSSYTVMDKYGAPQSNILVNFTILESTTTFVQVQIASQPAIFYNSGKSNTANKFSWNYTTTIYGQYQLVSCPGGCTGVSMDVIIYPLNIGYDFPTKILKVNVPLTQGPLDSYQVTFSPGPTDTGTIIINGETFPEYPFQGVGFNLSSLPVGSVIYLYNPVLITPVSIQQCTTRQIPSLVEPLSRIVSTVPFNKCIFNQEIQLEFPGKDIGECGCSWAYGGENCDCIAITTKYTERTCGGFGSEGTLQLGFDGQFYSTGQGENAGCFILSDGTSQCVTKDVGTCLFALLVDGAIWNYPAVYVDTVPANGQSVFLNIDEGGVGLEDGIEICQLQGNQLAYWFTASELTQFIKTAPIPSLISANSSGNLTTWPWAIDQPDTYFIKDKDPTSSITNLGGYSCNSLTESELCEAINFNNLAFNKSSCLTDGNVLQTCPGGGTVYYNNGPLQVYVVIFDNTSTATCDGPGPCGGPIYSSTTVQWICRCPSQAIQVSGSPSEVQIFADLLRTNLYPYN